MNPKLYGMALLLCTPLCGYSQSPSVARAEPENYSVVTATRTPQLRSETLAPTTVITRADIERLQARSVQELLQRSPGVSISNQGGDGKLTSLFLRGTESDQILVLVDGVRYGSATAGLAAFQDLPVAQIERIEIVRGPRSALYGSEAIGGVIQIFTRDGSEAGEGAKPYFSLSAGRYDTYEGQAGLSARSERAHYNVSLSATRTDGFDACSGRAPDPVTFAGGAGCFTDNENDDDGYDRVAGSLSAGYQFDSGLKLDLHVLRADGEADFDGFVNSTETRQQIYSVSAAYRPVQIWNTKLSVSRSYDESDNLSNGAFFNTFDTQRDSVSWQNDITVFGDDLITAGVDYRNERVSSTEAFKESSRYNLGGFLQYLAVLGDHQLQAAVRDDENEQFGNQFTGNAGYGWSFLPGYKLTLSYGTAFKAPTFNDLYFPDFPGFPPASNPDLEPEESESYEIGLLGEQAWGRWSLHAYETNIDDLIALDANFTPFNVNEARIRGVELGLGTEVKQWLVNLSGTWLDARDRSNGANTGNDLARRPDWSAQLDIDRPIRWFSLGGSIYTASAAFDDPANTISLDPYVLLDLRGEVRVSDAWRVQAKLANLLDEDYETAAFFNQPGRSLFITLRYQPG